MSPFDAITDLRNSFGWVNASYVYGLQIVNSHMKRALGAVTPWDTFKKALEEAQDPVDFMEKQAPYANGGKHVATHQGPVQYAHTERAKATQTHNDADHSTKNGH